MLHMAYTVRSSGSRTEWTSVRRGEYVRHVAAQRRYRSGDQEQQRGELDPCAHDVTVEHRGGHSYRPDGRTRVPLLAEHLAEMCGRSAAGGDAPPKIRSVCVAFWA